MAAQTGNPVPVLSTFQPILSAKAAKTMAVHGGIIGLLLTLSETWGAFLIARGTDPNTLSHGGERFDAGGPMTIIYVGLIVFGMALLLLATWRVWIGKGYVSATLLSLALALESMGKLASPNGFAMFWGLVFLAFTAIMVGAARACWYLRKAPAAPDEIAKTFDS
jgi:hypothetical protein